MRNYSKASLLLAVFLAKGSFAVTTGSSPIVRYDITTKPEELNVDPKTTYNDKFMALMESPCRPESDGYFGSTYGQAVRVTYGFKLEVLPLSSIVEVLDVVEDKIVDGVLSSSFPQMCGYRRRKLTYASGFRFFTFQEVEKCSPTVNAVNFCGVFTGQVNVFGLNAEEALSVLELIDGVLNPSDPTMLHSDVADMASTEEYHQVEGVSIHLEKEKGVDKEALGWAGIVLVLFAFGLAVWYFFLRTEKQGDTMNASEFKHKSTKSKWERLFRHKRREMDYDPAEKSITSSHEPEAGLFGPRETHFLNDKEYHDLDLDSSFSHVGSATGHMI